MTLETIIPILVTLVGGGAIGLAALVRRFSRDKLELAKDRAETDVIDYLTKQRDDARDERAAATQELSGCTQENQKLVEQIRILQTELSQTKAQNGMLQVLTQRLAAALDETKEQLQGLLEKATGA